jgi:hypothetical protein
LIYKGPNQYIECPNCGQEIELFARSEKFTHNEMTTIRCGPYADNRMRAPSQGCDAIIGLKPKLECEFEVYKMELV